MLLCILLFSTLGFAIGSIIPYPFPYDDRSYIDPCTAPFSRGYRGKDKGLKYYFVKSRMECFPFLYNGAGGSKNMFDSKSRCMTRCVPQDFFGCALNANSTGSCVIRSPGQEAKTCPAGSSCVNGPFGFGICCDSKLQERVGREYNPTCKKGKLVERAEYTGLPDVILPFIGRRCSDGFCPKNSKCIQRKWTAHCCEMKPDFDVLVPTFPPIIMY